ncbi:hypothetical protein JXB02_01430 [Candidatus Woesearchaeota archaeon]|nr:hypothetical protein [Candidatus Woesearchaeota archaeon]
MGPVPAAEQARCVKRIRGERGEIAVDMCAIDGVEDDGREPMPGRDRAIIDGPMRK